MIGCIDDNAALTEIVHNPGKVFEAVGTQDELEYLGRCCEVLGQIFWKQRRSDPGAASPKFSYTSELEDAQGCGGLQFHL